jgi:hypothetical protein
MTDTARQEGTALYTFLAPHMCGGPVVPEVEVVERTASGAKGVRIRRPEGSRIELAADLFPPDVNLAAIDPSNPVHMASISVPHGVAIHEFAHDAHTTIDWTEVRQTHGPAAEAAARLLEESRIERRSIAHRPTGRPFLRKAIKEILAEGMTGSVTAEGEAFQAAALILARSDGGTLDPSDTSEVTKAVESVIGAPMLSTLRALWQRALLLEDGDMELGVIGAAWAALRTDEDPESNGDGGRGEESESGEPSDVRSATSEAASQTAEAGEFELTEVSAEFETRVAEQNEREAQAAEERQLTERAAKQAATVFSPDSKKLTGRRPTTAESAAVQALTNDLRLWMTPNVRKVPLWTEEPEGRLSVSRLISRDAQKALTGRSNVAVFRSTKKLSSPKPEPVVALIVDASTSMDEMFASAASLSYIIPNGIAPLGGKFASCVFGSDVQALCPPGVRPSVVPRITSQGSTDATLEALLAMAGALPLFDRTKARLVVMITDNGFTGDAPAADSYIAKLEASGCRVISLNCGPMRERNHLSIQLGTPSESGAVIGQAIRSLY